MRKRLRLLGSLTLPVAWALIAIGFAVPVSQAQICSGDVTLASQDDVNGFDCTEILGSLAISGDDITDLSPLATLTRVRSGLYITNNGALTALTGLGAVELVGSFYVRDNSALTSLGGLEALTSVRGSLFIRNNDALPDLIGLENINDVYSLTIYDNSALTSLVGLGNLISADHLTIGDNDALTSLAGLDNLTSAYYFTITNNDILTSLAGLSSLSSIRSVLSITSNDALESLSGLEALTVAGNYPFPSAFSIQGNVALDDCACGLAGLISGDPPAFEGIHAPIIIEANGPGGTCDSAQAVLDAFASCQSVANTPLPSTPNRFTLAPAYPNPFYPATTISVNVPVASDLRLAVYDILGREVAVLLEGPVTAGHHEVVFNASNVPNGVYVVRLLKGDRMVQTQQTTVLR